MSSSQKAYNALQRVLMLNMLRRGAHQISSIEGWHMDRDHLANGVAAGLLVFQTCSLKRGTDIVCFSKAASDAAVGGDGILMEPVTCKRGGSGVAVTFLCFAQFGQHGGCACVIAYPLKPVDRRLKISRGVEWVRPVRFAASE